MTRRLLLAVALVASMPAAAFAKCAPSASEGISANKKWRAVPTLEGTFAFHAWDEAKKDWVEKGKGKVELPGHHVKTFVSDSGEHFVLFDGYGGVAIYASAGKLVKKLGREDLLTKDEVEGCPHKWACHPEGEWSQTPPSIAEDSKTVTLTVHSKRTLAFELATGKPAESWVVAGTCATPDMVKMHGEMNCVTQDWTCPRCKKEQKNSLVWTICPACCKELGVCSVCNKKVEKNEKK